MAESTFTFRADPGVGSEAAPIGSRGWAERVRLTMQSMVNDLPKTPERFCRYVDLIKEHRAWTLMNKPDHSFFKTFEEFCEYRQPYGLGKPFAEIRPYLEAAAVKPGALPSTGKTTLQLLTVAPAVVPVPPAMGKPNSGGHPKVDPERATVALSGSTAEEQHSATENSRTAKNLRAVLRAPEPVQDLYKAGLIGQVVAAKLGPKSPTPDDAAKVTAIASELVAVAKAAPKPKTEAERVSIQRAVNAKARALLGEPSTSFIATAKSTIARWAKAATDDEWRQIMKLFDDADMARAESATSTNKEDK